MIGFLWNLGEIETIFASPRIVYVILLLWLLALILISVTIFVFVTCISAGARKLIIEQEVLGFHQRAGESQHFEKTYKATFLQRLSTSLYLPSRPQG